MALKAELCSIQMPAFLNQDERILVEKPKGSSGKQSIPSSELGNMEHVYSDIIKMQISECLPQRLSQQSVIQRLSLLRLQ